MAQTIKIKRSSTSGNKLTSSNSVAGELGLNTADKALYIQTGSTNSDVVTIAHESTLKIDEVNGRIGIGTTSPENLLHISSSSGYDVVFDNTSEEKFRLRHGSSGLYLTGPNTNTLAFGVDQNHDVRMFDTSGNAYATFDGSTSRVGIGTTSPGTKLQISDSGTPVLRIEHTGGTARYVDIYNSGGAMYLRARNDTANGNIVFQGNGGGTNTEYARFQGNGRMGIGTTSPGTTLDVNGDIRAVQAIYSEGSSPRVQLQDTDGTNQFSFFQQSTSQLSLRLRNDTSDGSFLIAGYGSTTTTNRMLIGSTGDLTYYKDDGSTTALFLDASSGNVGIGTNTPDEALVVSGDGARIYVNSADYHVAMIGRRGSSGTSLDQGYLRLKDQGTNKVVLDTAGSSYFTGGNVGIGTTSPDTKLDIDGLVNGGIAFTSTQVEIDRQSVLPNGRIFYNDSRLIYDSPANGHRFAVAGNQGSNLALEIYSNRDIGFYNSSGAADLFWDASTSRLGIGTTSPDNKLHVYKGDSGHSWSFDGGDGLILENSDSLSINITTPAANSGNILFSDANARGQGRIVYDHSADYMGFMTAGVSNEHMRIDSSGRVGIGTTSPAKELDVLGTVRAIDANSYQHQLRPTQLISYGTDAIINAQSAGDDVLLRTQSNTRLIATAEGNVGIGTTSPQTALHIYDTPAEILRMQGNDEFAYASFYGTVSSNESRLGYMGFANDTSTAADFNFTNNQGGIFSFNAGITTTGTLASPPTIRLSNTTTAFTQGDNVGQIEFYHADPTDFTPGAFGIIRGVAGASGGEGSIQVLTNMPSEGTDANDVAIEFTGAGAVKISDAFTLPTSDGSGNQVLQTDGSGNVSWATISGVGTATTISDADGDTKIQTEESADEDKIRFDAAGVERFRIGSDIEVIAATDFNITGANRRINFTSGTGTVRTTGASSLHLGTNSTDRVTIDSSGNVGINQTNPTHRLQVAVDTDGAFIKRDVASNAANLSEFNSHRSLLLLNRNSGSYLAFGGNSSRTDIQATDLAGTPTAKIISLNPFGGNVGIGTTTPAKTLVVSGTFQATGEAFFSHFDNITSSSRMRDDLRLNFGTARTFAITGNSTNMHMKNGTTDVMTFDTSNRVGIGTTSPAKTLDVAANGSSQGIHLNISGVGRLQMYADGDRNYFKGLSGNGHRFTTTGGANVEIQNGGNVGIGSTNPQAVLDLGNGTNGRGIAWGGSSGTAHYNTIWSEYSSASIIIGAGLKGATDSSTFLNPFTGTYGYAAIELDSFSDDGIKFYTGADSSRTKDAAITPTERMRIHTTGGLSIGTTTAAGNGGLLVDNDIKTNSRLGIGSAGNTSTPALYNNSDTDTGVYWPAANTLGFVTGSTERARINSAGNVGIGTTSPGSTLDVQGNTNLGSDYIGDQYTTTLSGFSVSDGNNFYGSYGTLLLNSNQNYTSSSRPYMITNALGANKFAIISGTDATTDPTLGTSGNITSGSARLVIDNAGNVGIGTTSPGGVFDVDGTYGDFTVGNPNVGSRLTYYDTTRITLDSNNINFYTNSLTQRMRISSGGNVGIGTTTLASITSSVATLSLGGTNAGISGGIAYQTNGTTEAYHYTQGDFLLHQALGGIGQRFLTNNTERMRINSSGDWMVSNTVANVASAYNNQGGCGWVDSDNHFEAATTSNRSAAEFGRNNANSGDVITIRQQGTSVGMIGTEGGDSLVIQSNGSTGTGIRFHPSRAAVEPVRAGVTIDNTISLGADTRRFKDLHLSNAANIGHASIETSSTSTTATTQVAIATFAAATFRGAEFTIQVTNSTDSTYHITKVLLIHDGTTPGITEYGTVFTGSAAEATFDADISSGNVRLLATPASTDSMTFKVVRHCITV